MEKVQTLQKYQSKWKTRREILITTNKYTIQNFARIMEKVETLQKYQSKQKTRLETLITTNK